MKNTIIYKLIKCTIYFLIILGISCSTNKSEQEPTYLPIRIITDSYDLEGKETIEIKNIKMTPKKFVNNTTRDTVHTLHHLDKTGFHFYNTVAFLSENKGVIAGGTQLRIRTTKDGGLNWKENRFSKFSNAFHSVVINNKQIFAVGESKYLYKSDDFGTTWTAFNTSVLFEDIVFFDSSKYYKIKFLNNKFGVISGKVKSKPTLLKTIDGGSNWTKLELKGLEEYEMGISDFTILTEKQIVIVTLTGSCYITIDGGNNWKLIYNDRKSPLNSISFNNKNEGYIGGANSTLLHTKNQGETWTKIDLFSKNDGIVYYQKFGEKIKRISPNKATINISNILSIKNKTIITIASSNDFEKDFLYLIKNDNTIKSILKKNKTTVYFTGESYGINLLNNNLYILDRNNLYKTQIPLDRN